MLRRLSENFWSWYKRHETFNLAITAILFSWQIVHLYWLTTEVVSAKLFGVSFFQPSEFWRALLIVVDYAEIPAIIAATFLYVNEFKTSNSWKALLYLLAVNSQWLHIFWITDEFVVQSLLPQEHLIFLPVWLAWTAIMIDYLELPVIYDTSKRLYRQLTKPKT